jgi:hypothetical protein
MPTLNAWLPATRTRGGSLYVAIALILVIETAAVHLWLAARHPVIAWSLTALGVASLAWLVGDFRGQAGAGLELGSTAWRLRMPGRVTLDIPVAQLAGVSRPTWRELPPAGTAAYLNTAKPLDPNLLLELREPLPALLPLGVRRRVRLVGLHLVEPEKAVAAYGTRTVHCGEHGPQQATFVCRHLVESLRESRRVGFHCADDAANPRPDAWCGACEAKVAGTGGEWTDESEAFAGVTLLCGSCYDRVRQLNSAA